MALGGSGIDLGVEPAASAEGLRVGAWAGTHLERAVLGLP